MICVREPAVDGKVNDTLVKLLVGYLGIAKTRVTIVDSYTLQHRIMTTSEERQSKGIIFERSTYCSSLQEFYTFESQALIELLKSKN